ncbi:MAG: AarF/UbiB family protein [archaeon]
MIDFKKDVMDAKRLIQILTVMSEEGLGFLVSNIKIIHSKNYKKEKFQIALRKSFERLGPTFIKLGQLLSVRPDFLPRSYIKELEKLQDEVPEFSYKEVEKIIESELNNKIHTIFKKFDKKPLASASVSQVHKGVLRSNNKKIVVKIQRPEAEKTMLEDIDILYFIARNIEAHIPKTRAFRPVKIVEEFENWTKKELDFRIEANNIERFRKNFENEDFIEIPQVYKSYCTRKILVMDYLDGVTIKDLIDHKIKNRRIIHKGAFTFIKQIFEDGFFHADPHPSNLMLLKNGKLGLVDFGIVGQLDSTFKRRFRAFISALVNQDKKRTIETLQEFIIVKKGNYKKFIQEVSKAIDEFNKQSIERINISQILQNLIEIARNNQVIFGRELPLLFKTLMTLEGTTRELDPKTDLAGEIRGSLNQLIERKVGKHFDIKKTLEKVEEYREELEEIPKHINKIMDKLEKGELNINLVQKEEYHKEHKKNFLYLILGMVIVSGLAIITYSQNIKFLGIPVTLLGLVLLIVLLIYLVIILRER